jgi:hypothetical protein
MSIVKSSVTDVQIGSLVLQGLMSENGDFAIAVPQFADLIKTSRNTATRDIKRLTGKGSKTSITFEQWATPFNNRGVNVLTLANFERILFEYAMAGHAEAIALSRNLIGLSLHQLFCDAFNLQFEADERQRWLVERDMARHDFRPLTDQLQRYGFTNEYGRYVSAFQTKADMKSGERDTAPAFKLANLNRIQTRLITLMECGIEPWDALKRI